MTLQSQYKEFIQKNPNYSHLGFNEWLKFHSKKLEKSIKEIKDKMDNNRLQKTADSAIREIQDAIESLIEEIEEKEREIERKDETIYTLQGILDSHEISY